MVEMDKMKVLKLKVKRANNSTSGNPRFQILDWDNRILFDRVVRNGFIKKLKSGFFTKPDASDNYSIGNPEGFTIDSILILSKIKY